MQHPAETQNCKMGLHAMSSKNGHGPSCGAGPYSLGGHFGYYLFFLCSGEGKGESEAPGRGGGRFFIENPRRGEGGLPGGWGPGCSRTTFPLLSGRSTAHNCSPTLVPHFVWKQSVAKFSSESPEPSTLLSHQNFRVAKRACPKES